MRRLFELRDRILPWVISLCMVLLPVWDKLTPVLLLLWALLLLGSPDRSTAQASAKGMLVLVAFCVFYLAHVLGLIHTESYQEAYRELVRKSYLLVLPVLIYFSRDIISRHLKFMLFSYLLVSLAAALFCISYGLFHYLNAPAGKEDAWELLFYDDISVFMHPSYLAMHYMLALSVALYLGRIKYKRAAIGKVGYYVVAAILGLFIFLLSSKSSLIALFVLLVIFGAGSIARHHSLKLKLFILGAILALGSIFFTFNARFIWFYQSLEHVEWSRIELEQGEDYSQVPVRLLMWRIGIHIVQDNWLTGIGTGNSEKVLKQVFDHYGMQKLEEKNYNFHNQFLESTVILGAGGALLLGLILLASFRASLRPFSPLLVVVLVTVVVNLFFESMLNRQAGILFFTFFISFFAFTAKRPQKPPA